RRAHAMRKWRRDEAVIDPLTGGNRRAFVLAMSGGNPRIDEPGHVIETTVARARGSDDAVVFERIPFEIEVAEQNRGGRHRWHRALGPTGVGLRMAAAPRAAFAGCAFIDCEQRFDLWQ